ncbi:MAG TPA: hypothetical protein VGZ23_07590 [bacterium]|nr:hypothetical protein [bacterium]
MVPDADSPDRLAPTRRAIEQDVRELRARVRGARAKVVAALGGITELGQIMSTVVRRRDRNGAARDAER